MQKPTIAQQEVNNVQQSSSSSVVKSGSTISVSTINVDTSVQQFAEFSEVTLGIIRNMYV